MCQLDRTNLTHIWFGPGCRLPWALYDILVQRALTYHFVNCSQTNDINIKNWGIQSSTTPKILSIDIALSRLMLTKGLHMPSSELYLGTWEINAIGSGVYYLRTPPRGGTWSFCALNYAVLGRETRNPYCVLYRKGADYSASLLVVPIRTHDFGLHLFICLNRLHRNLFISMINHREDLPRSCPFFKILMKKCDDLIRAVSICQNYEVVFLRM